MTYFKSIGTFMITMNLILIYEIMKFDLCFILVFIINFYNDFMMTRVIRESTYLTYHTKIE